MMANAASMLVVIAWGSQETGGGVGEWSPLEEAAVDALLATKRKGSSSETTTAAFPVETTEGSWAGPGKSVNTSPGSQLSLGVAGEITAADHRHPRRFRACRQ